MRCDAVETYGRRLGGMGWDGLELFHCRTSGAMAYHVKSTSYSPHLASPHPTPYLAGQVQLYAHVHRAGVYPSEAPLTCTRVLLLPQLHPFLNCSHLASETDIQPPFT